MNNIDSKQKMPLLYDCEGEIKIYLESRSHGELGNGPGYHHLGSNSGSATY